MRDAKQRVVCSNHTGDAILYFLGEIAEQTRQGLDFSLFVVTAADRAKQAFFLRSER